VWDEIVPPYALNSRILEIVFRCVKFKWTDDIPTMATDGEFLYVNSKFWGSLTNDEQIAVLRHEGKHILYDHCLRKEWRDPFVWNIACDMVINTEDTRAKFKLPSGAYFLPKELDTPILPSSETVYDWLVKNSSKEEFRIDLDVLSPPGTEGAETTQKKIAKGLEAEFGSSSGEEAGINTAEVFKHTRDLLDEISHIPWRELLNRFFAHKVKADYNWMHPNRRFLAGGQYLPSNTTTGLSNVGVAIDVSSSMDRDTVNRIVEDVAHLRGALQIEELHLIAFNTRVMHDLTFRLYDPIDFSFFPMGGTSFSCIFEWASEKKVDVLLILTDGEAGPPKTYDFPPDRVIWLIYDSQLFPEPGRVYHVNGSIV